MTLTSGYELHTPPDVYFTLYVLMPIHLNMKYQKSFGKIQLI